MADVQNKTGGIVDDLRRGERPLSIARAAREGCLRRDGRPPSPSTLYRWINEGVNGVHLEFIEIGSRMYTTRSALLRFIARLSNLPSPQAADAGRDHKQAMDDLDQAGI